MKKLILAVVLIVVHATGWAAGGGYPLDHAPVNLNNQSSLLRGARLFVNYCMGCHSAEHQRYNRFARDAGVSEELVAKNLVLTPDTKVGDLMRNTMPKEDAKTSFGPAPPDLTLIARARGADYLYTFLRTFYADRSRPSGVNNAAFPATAMPHVLWELQGIQHAVHEAVTDENGNQHDAIAGFELAQPGALTADEYDSAIADLVNFLVYIAEPIQLERQRIGFWVLLYLVLAFGVFYLLKREYWKDVH